MKTFAFMGANYIGKVKFTDIINMVQIFRFRCNCKEGSAV